MTYAEYRHELPEHPVRAARPHRADLSPRAELESATLALAERIAESSSFALRLMKRSLNRTADIQGFRAALNAHFDTHQSHI
jgi:enoyl-CoA hydratase/carnithine racemase